MTPPTESPVRRLLDMTAAHAAAFLESLDDRPITPSASLDQVRQAFEGELQDEGLYPHVVIDELVDAADGGVVASPSGRYFGFVIGGGLPAALAADWLAATWDQNAGLYVGGPAAAVVEEVAGRWLLELFGLPPDASVAFVTGCQMAHFTALAAARYHLLAGRGWDVNRDGLFGAPPLRVLAGADRHVTIDRALRHLGIGTACVQEVETGASGGMGPEHLGRLLGASEAPTIVCVQAGEVNTGGFDPIDAVCDVAGPAGAWVHVDGAFGLWAAVDEGHRHLVRGLGRADSWATDAHKWLNVPYDSGLAFCAHPDSHRASMSVRAGYLVHDDEERREQMDWNPEFSRRARGFAVYAALRSLGRSGLSDLVARGCAHAEGARPRAGRRGAQRGGAEPGPRALPPSGRGRR
ncbi:MAG: pyridoxal-dependent decarboxylase [Acidimicrobiales bacterium]